MVDGVVVVMTGTEGKTAMGERCNEWKWWKAFKKIIFLRYLTLSPASKSCCAFLMLGDTKKFICIVAVFFFPFLKPKDHWSPLPEHLEQPFGGLHTLSNFLGSKFICMWRPVPHVYIQNSWNAPRMVVLAASADQGNIYVPCITCRIPPFTKFSWRMAFLFYFTKLCNVLRLNYALG